MGFPVVLVFHNLNRCWLEHRATLVADFLVARARHAKKGLLGSPSPNPSRTCQVAIGLGRVSLIQFSPKFMGMSAHS